MDCFHKLCLSGISSENSQASWDLANRRTRGYQFDTKWIFPMGSYAWGIQVSCSRKEVALHFLSRTEHLNTVGITSHGRDSSRIKQITPGHPIPKISTSLTIFWWGTWKTEFLKTIHRQERTWLEETSDGFHKKCSINLWTILMFELVLCCHTAVRCIERT